MKTINNLKNQTLFTALYLGCNAISPDGPCKVFGIGTIMFPGRVTVHFGSNMIVTKNSIDGGYDKKRNYGEYSLQPQSLVPLKATDDSMGVINMPGGVALSLRLISSLTDEEAIHIARLAHQMPEKDFKVKRTDHGLIHVERTDSVGITYHISIYKDYGTVNANTHFSKTETEPFKSFKTNIGETTLSARLPVPYIAICDYLREIEVLIPFKDLSVKDILSYGWAVVKPIPDGQSN